tara:strand:- start:1081 stop:1377 length:297 start_codon:yes stop_codon:yes gene_type:complete
VVVAKLFDVDEATSTFRHLDVDGGGRLSIDNVREHLEARNMKMPEDTVHIFQNLEEYSRHSGLHGDAGNPEVCFTVFLAVFLNQVSTNTKQHYKDKIT